MCDNSATPTTAWRVKRWYSAEGTEKTTKIGFVSEYQHTFSTTIYFQFSLLCGVKRYTCGIEINYFFGHSVMWQTLAVPFRYTRAQ
jgi:hypothetical protein